MARKRKSELPPHIYPVPGGDAYKLAVFKIVSKDELGRPEECTYVPDERVVELVGGEEFMTAYVPWEVARKRPPRREPT